MNIFTIITTLYLAKVDQHQSIKTIRMIKSDETSTHCFRLLNFLIAAKNRPDISPQTMMQENAQKFKRLRQRYIKLS